MEKIRAARLSVASNLVLMLAKIVVGLAIHSVSVLAEAVHSGIDLLAAVIAYFSVAHSSRPADEKHPFGHGKIENVSGTLEAILIFIAAGWIMYESIDKLRSGHVVQAIGPGLVVMAASALVNTAVSRHLRRVARETDSVALEADALHLSTDVFTSVGVLAGLALIRFTGIQAFDPIVAIGVALLIVKAAYDLTKSSFLPLLDISLPEEEQRIIWEILNRYRDRFVEAHKLRTRKAGAERHIDIHLVVPRVISVGEAHTLCDEIEAAIEERLRNTRVLIHVEPCDHREDGECQTTCQVCDQRGPEGSPAPGNQK